MTNSALNNTFPLTPAQEENTSLYIGGTEEITLDITVIMPCLNEAETLEACVKEACAAIAAAGVRGEVVVADNGSTDGSVEIAERSGARVVHIRRKGYGNALLGGINSARGEYVLMADSDGSYSFHDLPKFLHELQAGNDLVMGCRLPGGGGTIEQGAMPWHHRWIGNPVLSRLGKLFFKAKIDDFHCGIRAFRRDAILNLGLRTTGMEFASEMVVRATLGGLRVSQVPVTLRPDGRSRPPHLRSWRDGWRHLRFLLLYSPNWLFLVPGVSLALFGLIGFLVLTWSPLQIGQIIFDTNTLLVCSMSLLLGVQVLSSYAFIKAYAISAGLLPPDPRITKLLENTKTVEYGLVVGLLFMIVGLALLVYAVFFWGKTGFGDLSYSSSLRVVIPGVTLLGLGMQTIFTGFGLAILGIKHR
jgi:glycosyltransferase involved in cell wall biosynthesis